MDCSGKLEITENENSVTAYQHIDNGGVVYELTNDGQLRIEMSYFGYGAATITIPFFNEDEFISFLHAHKKQTNTVIKKLVNNNGI